MGLGWSQPRSESIGLPHPHVVPLLLIKAYLTTPMNSSKLKSAIESALAAAAGVLNGIIISIVACIVLPNVGAADGLQPLKPGDILIADSNGAITKFDPRSGVSSVLASGWPLWQPFGIAVDTHGRILVTDTGSRAVIRINPAQGTKEIVASIPGLPFGLAVNDSGDIFVANAEAILRIKAGSTSVSVLAAGDPLRVPLGIALGADGNIFVADGSGCLVKVDVNSHTKTLISRGPPLAQPVGIALDHSGNLIIADSVAACVLQINPLTRSSRIISQGEYLETPVNVAVDKDGSLLTSDPDAFNYAGGIIRVDPGTGTQVSLMQGQGSYVNPRGFVIVRTGQVNRRK